MVEYVCTLPGAGAEAGQNRPLPLLLPPHVQIEDDILDGGPCPTWRSGKSFPVGRLATYKLLVSVDAVVGVEILATTLADKHMVTVLPNIVLVRR